MAQNQIEKTVITNEERAYLKKLSNIRSLNNDVEGGRPLTLQEQEDYTRLSALAEKELQEHANLFFKALEG